MEFSFEWLTEDEVLTTPAYWLITIGCIIAVLIGFGAGGLMSGITGGGDQAYAIPKYMQVIIVSLIPICAYFVVKITNR